MYTYISTCKVGLLHGLFFLIKRLVVCSLSEMNGMLGFYVGYVRASVCVYKYIYISLYVLIYLYI